MTASLPFPLRYALEKRSLPDVSLADTLASVDAADKQLKDLQGQIDALTVSTSGDGASTTVVTTTERTGTQFQALQSPAAKPSPTATGDTPTATPKDSQADSRIFAIVPGASTVSYQPMPAEVVSATNGAVVVEDRGSVFTTIRISGTFGFNKKAGTDSEGGGVFWDGRRLHAAFIGFVRAMWKEQAEGHAHELVWRDYYQGEHYICTIAEIETDLQAVVPSYRVTLRGYATPESAPQSLVDEHLGWLRKGAQQAADAVARATYWAEVARLNIESAIDLASDVLEPLRAVNDLTRELGRFAQTVQSARQIPKTATALVFGAIENTITGIADLANALGVPAQSLRWARDATSALRATETEVELAMTGAALTTTGPSYTYRVREGDTLPDIARRFYRDRNQWPIVARENDLRPPYVSASALPYTAAPGDTIMLPGPVVDEAIRDTVTVGVTDAEERLYGRDFRRNPETLEWVVAPDGQGYQTMAGRDVVAQDIAALLGTTRGANRLFPHMGLAIVGRPAFTDTVAAAASDLREQLLGDDRVRDVLSPVVEQNASLVRMTAQLRLRGTDDVLPLDLPVG